jgi:hypothetical protein
MKKSGWTMLIVCLLWQSPALAFDPMTLILGKVVDTILSGDEKDNPKTNARNQDEESPKTESQKKHSGYQFQLSWQLPNQKGAYSGVLEMRGKTGVFRVTTPKGDNIEQDMTAEPAGDRGVVVWGSNPRYFENQLPADYSPNIFTLSKESGEWTITSVADEVGNFANVTLLSASPL